MLTLGGGSALGTKETTRRARQGRLRLALIIESDKDLKVTARRRAIVIEGALLSAVLVPEALQKAN